MNAAAARVVPVLRWLPGYRGDDAVSDLRAGATVAVLLVPQAMAYAALAGVPPIAGLYAAMVSLVVYALLGTSRFISVGPVAIDSLLTAAAVAPLADGDPGRYVMLTALLTVMIGVVQTLAGVARLGALVHLLSVPVIAGFTTGAALTIGLTQVTDLLGLEADGGPTSFVESAARVLPALDTLDPGTSVLGLLGVALLVAVRRWVPRVPGPLLLVVAGTVVVVASGLPVRQVGAIPSGIPLPAWPDGSWEDVRALLAPAVAIALISFMESISTGSVFARRTRTRVDPDQELVAVGVANAAAGLMQGMPVAGGFSRGAVNFDAGARTPMSGVVAAAFVAVSVLFFTPLLARVPTAVLAAVIVVAVAGLVDLRGAITVAHVRRSDAVALGVTTLATLALGPTYGLGVGVGVSFVLFLRQFRHPHLPELGYVAECDAFRNVERHRAVTHPEVLAVRVDAPLSFVGARAISDDLTRRLHERAGVRFLVLDATAITTADFTGVEILGEIVHDLDLAGVEVHLGGLRGPVRDVLERTTWFAGLRAAGQVRDTVESAVAALPVTSPGEGRTWLERRQPETSTW